jgi:hypothetical protein
MSPADTQFRCRLNRELPDLTEIHPLFQYETSEKALTSPIGAIEQLFVTLITDPGRRLRR